MEPSSAVADRDAPRVADEIRERRIDRLRSRWLTAMSRGQRTYAEALYSQFVTEINRRSRQQVSRMERERGIGGSAAPNEKGAL